MADNTAGSVDFDSVVAEVEKELGGGDPTERLETAADTPDETPNEGETVEEKAGEEEGEEKEEKEEKSSSPRERGPDGKFLPKKEAAADEEEEEEEPLGLNAAQLEAIEKDPSLRAVYKSMQRGFTKKTQTIAEKRKALEEKEKFYDWVQNDPDNALKAMVQAKGWKLAEEAAKAETPAEKKVVSDKLDALKAKWSEKVGPDAANILYDLVSDTAKEIARGLVENEVQPLKAQAETLQKASAERSIASAVAEFGAKITAEGGEWDETTTERMSKLIGKIEPAQGVGIDEYLDTLYKVDAYEQSKKAGIKERLKRLKRVEGEGEPTNTVRPSKDSPARITPDMKDDDAFELAISLAQKELAG